MGSWRAHGSGRVTSVGTVPDRALAVALNRWLSRGFDSSWHPQTDAQTVTGGTAVTGTRLHIVHNWSFEPSNFTVPAEAADLLSEKTYEAGDRLVLGAWDVQVLVPR